MAMMYEGDRELRESEVRMHELQEEKKEFDSTLHEFVDQANARKELAELMQKHGLYIRIRDRRLEVVKVMFSRANRVVYATTAKSINPIDLVNGDLDAKQA